MSQIPETPDYEKLRSLLVGDELRRLEEIEKRLNADSDRSEELAAILSTAIRRARELDPEFDDALREPVDENLRKIVQQNPQRLADSLFPIMGPAIRRSITETLNGFIENINQTLEHSLSLRSIRWRFEALRTGRPFSEIVFKNTMRYRVEQVFLIHSATGLLMASAVNSDVAAKDSDAVSAMLTAIQDFVRDSFGAENETLDKIDVGEHTVWLVRGPHAMLAAVVRGMAPAGLRNELTEIVERIHRDHAELLSSFNGDTSGMGGIDLILQDSLQKETMQEKQESALKKSSVSTGRVVFGLLLILVIAGIGYAAYQKFKDWREDQEINLLIRELNNSPGISVTEARDSGNIWHIQGLRDPLAIDPETLLKKKNIDPGHVQMRFTTYESLDGDFLLPRVRRAIRKPETVELEIKDGVIIASGTASAEWIRNVRYQAFLPQGITAIDVSRVAPHERASVGELADKLTAIRIPFQTGVNFDAGAKDALDEAAALIRELVELDRLLDLHLVVTLVGDSDGTEDERKNIHLRLNRSDAVKNSLIRRGISSRYLNAMALKAYTPPGPEDFARRQVSFRVRFDNN